MENINVTENVATTDPATTASPAVRFYNNYYNFFIYHQLMRTTDIHGLGQRRLEQV